MKLLAKLEKTKEFWFLLILATVFFFLRMPSLFEPYWYGDEGIYQTIGIAVQDGRLLFKEIWDNKPPLLYLVYALFSGDQFTLRLVSTFVGIACVGVFYFLAKQLFTREKIAKLTTIAFAILFGLPLLEGNIANAENFMMLPILLAGYYIVKKNETLTPKQLAFVGVLLSIAFLFKIVGIFDIAAFTLFLVFTQYKNISQVPFLIKRLLPFVIGVVAPVILCGLYFLVNNAFLDFFNGSFRQMVGYVSYGNTFIIAQGLLIIKLLLLMLFVVYLFLNRKKYSPSSLFILLWFAFSLFNAFFAGRSYTHYLLVLLPSFILFAGLAFDHSQKVIPNHVVLKAMLIIIFVLLLKNFHYYGKTLFYYQNFVMYITRNKSIDNYQAFFDRNTPRDYQLASFLNKHMQEKDTLFIWGNNAQLYKLTNKLPPGRFTVQYHMSANKETIQETQKALQKVRPTFIVIISSKQKIPFSLTNYQQRYTIKNASIYESLF